MRGVNEEASRRYAALEADFARCERLRLPNPPPKGFMDRLEMLVALGTAGTFYLPSQPVLDRVVADLDAITTRDPALRSGRAAWRKRAAHLRAMPVVERPCELIEQWAATEYAPESAPGPSMARADRFFRDFDDEALRSKLIRAERRMRALGVSASDAYRFRGDGFFDGVSPEGFEGE